MGMLSIRLGTVMGIGIVALTLAGCLSLPVTSSRPRPSS